MSKRKENKRHIAALRQLQAQARRAQRDGTDARQVIAALEWACVNLRQLATSEASSACSELRVTTERHD